jgi:hypothetical protein
MSATKINIGVWFWFWSPLHYKKRGDFFVFVAGKNLIEIKNL